MEYLTVRVQQCLCSLHLAPAASAVGNFQIYFCPDSCCRPWGKGGDCSESGALPSTYSALLGTYSACWERKSCISSHLFAKSIGWAACRGASVSHLCLCPSFLTLVKLERGSSVPLQPVCGLAAACLLQALCWVYCVQILLAYSWRRFIFPPLTELSYPVLQAFLRARVCFGTSYAPAAEPTTSMAAVGQGVCGASSLPPLWAFLLWADSPMLRGGRGELLVLCLFSPLSVSSCLTITLWTYLVTQSLAYIYCFSSVFSSSINCGV